MKKSGKLLSFILLLSWSISVNGQSPHGTVYLFLSDACRICQEMTPFIKKIHSDFSEAFDFVLIFPNLSSESGDIEMFLEKYDINIKYFTDYDKSLTLKFNAAITPEAVVFDHGSNRLLYKGRINDLYYQPGKRRQHIQHHDLQNALFNIKHGIPQKIHETPAIGCYINFTDETDEKY
jgi:hypothetical protein